MYLAYGWIALLVCCFAATVNPTPIHPINPLVHKEQASRVQLQAKAPLQTPTGQLGQSHTLKQLQRMIHQISNPETRPESVTCDVCMLAFDALQALVAANKTDDEIIDEVTVLCVTLGIADEGVCYGMLEEAIPEVVYVFKDTENEYQYSSMCGFIFGGDCVIVDQFLQDFDWTIEFPSPEPPYNPPPQPDPNSPKLRIVHISDLHMDPLYAEGSVANCNEPLCCRSWSTTQSETVTYSGKWGAAEGSCDLPQVTLESMLQYIADSVEFDYIYWTGDIPPHDVWNQTKDGNLEALRNVAALIQQYIPSDKIVYPAVGNHESEPVNSFPVPPVYQDYDIAYLYNQLDETWRNFVPNLTDDLVLKGGYYWSKIRPGLRILSVNMNYCHGANWWLLVQSQDPTEEVQWIIDQLDEAEQNNEKVHLIGHIPPGECTYVWSRNYRDILDRYKNTISGHFYGHTHKDEFEIVYDDVNTTVPISFSNIGPSATTYSNLNPAFRVYTIDGDYNGSSFAVLDYDEYYMDVAQANTDGTPTWTKLYSALDSYGLSAYTPEEWDNFVTRMETDDDLFKLFYSHYYRKSDPGTCEGACKTGMLCGLRTGWSGFTPEGC